MCQFLNFHSHNDYYSNEQIDTIIPGPAMGGGDMVNLSNEICHADFYQN
jgi:hypothetical protein